MFCHRHLILVILFLAKELRTEVENLAARLHYMEEAKADVRADIAVMRRAAEKADTEVTKAEMEKKKQVSLIIIIIVNQQTAMIRSASLVFSTWQ